MAAREVRLNTPDTLELALTFFGRSFAVAQAPASGDHGLVLWDAAVCFLRFLEHNPREAGRLRGRRVLELGAGTGLLGIVLAHCLDCAVTLTDLPAVCGNLAANAAANALPPGAAGSLRVLPYAWDGTATGAAAAALPVDAVVGTDVAYSEAQNPLLLQTAAALARASGPRTAVWLCNELRCLAAQAVFDAAAPALFRTVKRVPAARLHPEWRGCEMLLFELQARPAA